MGDLLVEAGLASQAQVDDAVRAQVTLGGRLGTVMVETAHIDLDELAKVLGRQHRLPAALEAHFQRADAELQQLLSPELAAAHQCVPLVRAGSRVIVAATDPLDDAARDAIAAGLGIEPERVVVAIAAELRVHYYLELVYGIARAPRYLRPAPSDDSGPSEDNFEYDERRRYVKTLATIAERAESRAKDKAPSVAMVNARTENENIELIDWLRRIEACNSRTETARLGIEAIAHHEPNCQAAVLLAIRGPVALSWVGFCRDGTELPAIAVRLDKPGLGPAAIKRKEITRAFAGDLGAVDFVLIAALGVPHGELVMAPIGIDGEVLMLIAIALPQRFDLTRLEAITAALSTAFTRIVEAKRAR